MKQEEKELKFILTEEQYCSILSAQDATLIGTQQQYNRYFESSDLALNKSWGMLRIRDFLGKDPRLTLKFGLSLQEGFLCAVELEQPWLGEVPEFLLETHLSESFRQELEVRSALRSRYDYYASLSNERSLLRFQGWSEVFELDRMEFCSGEVAFELELETTEEKAARSWIKQRWGDLNPATESKYARVLRKGVRF